ncbi:MAG: hypothetical protein KAS61_07365 [Spirochaetes bacterium]|nr:hypothetical protein [Spirochaetota bacterium]
MRRARVMKKRIVTAGDRVYMNFFEVDPVDWHEMVVKPDIAEKLDCVVKLPGYESKYLKDVEK